MDTSTNGPGLCSTWLRKVHRVRKSSEQQIYTETNSKVKGRETELCRSGNAEGKQQNLLLAFESYEKAAERPQNKGHEVENLS